MRAALAIAALFICALSKASIARAIPVPLRVNEWVIGEVEAQLADDPLNVRVARDDLLPVLEEFLQPDRIESLRESGSWLSLNDLESLGYQARFLVNELEVQMEIPAEFFRQEKLILLGALGNRTPGPILRPESRSFFLNFRAQQSFDQPDALGSNRRGPVTGDYDLAARIDPIVLESFGSTEEGSPQWHQRQDTRLVWDREVAGERWILGDLTYPIASYQGFLPTLGLGVTKDTTFSPDQVAYSQSETEIVLRRWARVEIWINNTLYQTLRLKPGRFNLQSLPLNKGLNRVQVRIFDDAGENTIRDFPFLSDNQLLVPGVSQYSYNLGVKGLWTNRGKEYEEGVRQGSFYHRHGINKHLTLGLNAQGAEAFDMIGAELLTATMAGLFSFEAAGARTGGFDRSYAGRFRFRSYELFSNRALFTGCGIEGKERGFNRTPALGATSPPYEAFPWTYEAFLGWRLHADIRATIGGSYAQRREDMIPTSGTPLENASSAYAILGIPLRSNLNLGVELSSSRKTGTRDDRVTLQMSWFDQTSPTQLFLSHVNEERGSRAQLSYEPRRGPRFSATAEAKGRTRDLETGVAYAGMRANAGLEARQIFDPSNSLASTSNSQRWHFASALGIVNGRWFLSRPISDSVALLEADLNLQGKLIRVNASEDVDDGDFYTRERIPLPELQSYRDNMVRLSNEEPASSDQLERENFRLRPRYKSAFYVPVKAQSTLLIRATLINIQGAPRPLIAGEIFQHGRSVGTFFTDRQGVAHLEGLGPGPAELRFYNEALRVFQFEVPDDREGTWDVGAWEIRE